MGNTDTIHIEVAYATTKEQIIIPLEVPATIIAEQAIEKSEILNKFPKIDLTKHKVGIFSRICTLKTALREGDRLEIYRPLIADPIESRKQRAAQNKKMKQGNV
jgi:putative ubiquitin-RnfH superfamily antitoxin RatB of RatAB toxin-antitoxin module